MLRLFILGRLYKWWGRWYVSNLIGCQNATADRTAILMCGVYTISVDFRLSLQCLVAPSGHTAILTCGVLL